VYSLSHNVMWISVTLQTWTSLIILFIRTCRRTSHRAF